jgi:hypothetical protein
MNIYENGAGQTAAGTTALGAGLLRGARLVPAPGHQPAVRRRTGVRVRRIARLLT